MDINKIIKNVAKNRPLYHSEADLQFAIGEQIAKEDEKVELRFEKPIMNQAIDLIYKENAKITGIELKYKTAELKYEFNKEFFSLKNHAAVDIGRFDVIADIQKLENFIKQNEIHNGYMIFVTNCSNYWENNKSKNTNDNEFKLIEGREITGKLNWWKDAKETTYGKKRIKGLTLEKSYSVEWKDFSEIKENKNGIFKYLVFEIPSMLT